MRWESYWKLSLPKKINSSIRFFTARVEIWQRPSGAQNLLGEVPLYSVGPRVQLTRRTMCSNNLRDACWQHNYYYVPKRPWVLSRLWSCNFVSLFKQFYLAHKLNNWHTSWHSLRGGCCARRATKGEGKIEFLWTAKRGVIKKYHTPCFCLCHVYISHYQFMHLCVCSRANNGDFAMQCAQKHTAVHLRYIFWNLILYEY